MFIAFLIMLREGIEAALIVGIVAGFLKQSGQSHLMTKVWMGVALAALMCLAVGYGIHHKTGEMPQQQQEAVAAIIGLIAVGMMTYMVVWMQKAARSMRQHLQQSVTAALSHGQGWALVSMAFLAVVREGLESVFFLIAVFQQSPTWGMPMGAVLGLITAIFIGALIYQGGVRINLSPFFRWTGVFLIVVAAGLLAGSLRALHEAGIWNYFQDIAFHSAHILHEDSPLGVLLGGFFGYTDHPTQGEVALWLLYLIPMLSWFWYASKPTSPRLQSIHRG